MRNYWGKYLLFVGVAAVLVMGITMGKVDRTVEMTVNSTTQPNVCAGASAPLPDAPPEGQTRGFQINAPSGCQWKLDTTNPNWVAVKPPSGIGPANGEIRTLGARGGTITFSVRSTNDLWEVRSQRSY